MVTMEPPILAFDLGGTHVAAAAVTSGVRIGELVTVSLARRSSADDIWAAIEEAGLAALDRGRIPLKDLQGISMAVPSPFDYTDGVSLMEHKLPALFGISLRDRLSTRFGLAGVAVVFLNDAAAFLLGEVAVGQLRNCRTVAFTLGTGIGSAFAESGKVLLDDDRIPPGGEIWNLRWRDGTVEDVLGTRAFYGIYQNLGGVPTSVEDIARQARANDVVAMSTFHEFGRRLGDVATHVVATFSPNMIILGGSIARSADLFLPAMQHRFVGSAMVQVSSLFEKAALRGAAEYWHESCWPGVPSLVRTTSDEG